MTAEEAPEAAADKRSISIRVESDLYDRIEARALADGKRSIAQTVVLLLEAALPAEAEGES